MYLNKKNLLGVSMVKADADIPGLDNIHVRADGSTVASNRVSCLLVSPVKDQVKKLLKQILREKECGAITLTSDTVKDIIKNLGTDKKFGGMAEHCCLENDGEIGDGSVEIYTTDGVKKGKIKGKAYRRPYIDYGVFLQALLRNTKKRVIVNLPRLLVLLQTIDKIIKTGDEDNVIFIEFGNNGEIIIRGLDAMTGQRVVGIMNQYDYKEQKWLPEDKWELSLRPEKRIRHKKGEENE
jgi:hypothetical protein